MELINTLNNIPMPVIFIAAAILGPILIILLTTLNNWLHDRKGT